MAVKVETDPTKTKSSPKEDPKPTSKKLITRRKFNQGVVTFLGTLGLFRLFNDAVPMPLDPRPDWTIKFEQTGLPDNYEQTLIPPKTNLSAATNRTGYIRLADGRDVIFSTFTAQGELLPPDPQGKRKLTKDSIKTASNIVTVANRNTRKSSVTGGSAEGRPWLAPFDQEEEDLRAENKGTSYKMLAPFVDNGKLCVFLDRNMPSGALWEHYGTEIAILDMSTDSPKVDDENIIKLPRRDEKSNSETRWGVAVTQDEQYTYIYGSTVTKHPNDPLLNTRDIRVARVKNGKVTDISQWEFQGAESWIPVDQSHTSPEKAFRNAESQATPIIDGSQDTADSFSAHIIGDNTVIVSKRANMFNQGNCVDAYIAKSPSGPFIRKTIIEPLPDFSGTKHALLHASTQINSALFHPEASPNKNLIILSIGPSENFLGEVENNVETYTDVPLFVNFN